MEIDLSVFHFLRPWWLVLLVPALMLPWLWRRSRNVRLQWRRFIAPELLAHLIVGEAHRRRLQPVDTIGILLGLGALCAAGPTWEQVRPPFDQDLAPMVVVLSLAKSMGATDIAPSRLDRAKTKVLDIARSRKGARTGLIVFGGSAHLVVPPTDDLDMLTLYVPALSPDLMPHDGKRMDLGLAEAERLLAHETTPGTIVFVSDGIDPAVRDTFVARAKASKHQLLWLAVGTPQGGVIRRPDGTADSNDTGQAVATGLDQRGIQSLANAADIPLASLRADEDDVSWVRRRAQAFLADAEAAQRVPVWRENGFWLIVPLLLIVLGSFRRGWAVKWSIVAAFLVGMSSGPEVVRAADATDAVPANTTGWRWIDAFATHDQQGRWYFSRGDFATAAARFDDLMWKGRAQYAAGAYEDALATFSEALARSHSAEAAFYVGNTLAKLEDIEGAIQAYQHALALHPNWPPAKNNLALMETRKKQNEDAEDEPQAKVKADEITFDKPKGKGMTAMVAMPTSEDIWMRGLNTSPAVFLRQRFAVEAQHPAGVRDIRVESGAALAGSVTPASKPTGEAR
ncbi:vWA domain-containing protein [Pandoraea norimbergensis]|uniref:vWA domain-containing protein n=1 Tax=Pandoraea norimbergensis TaxID=93219 RepID=UPI0007E4E1AF|nr:VWA domain-containing protein [Pandoraea norimbergensis]AOX47947.1 hypothetical protein AT302_20305 [Pandoraea norimbergensis]